MSRYTRYLDALEESAKASPDPDVIRHWAGWGPLAPLIDEMHRGTGTDNADVARLRTLQPATVNVDNSFYTPEALITACWGLVTASGLTGGRALEPGCGSGLFIAADPHSFSWTGVEEDPTAARMARALNPDAVIAESRYEVLQHAPSRYDLVIGNVPFANTRVLDWQTREFSPSVHMYFLTRALEELRRGGLLVCVTSRFVIDSPSNAQLLADAGEFIGAVRLPSGTFPGTDVVADVIVMRAGRSSGALQVADWFTDHPEMIAGTMEHTGWRNGITVRGDEDDTARAFGHLTRLVAGVCAEQPAAQTETLALQPVEDADGHPIGSFQLVDGGIVEITDDGPVPVKTNRELTALIGLRDLAARLIEAETQGSDGLDELRAETLAAYRAYVARWGALGRGTLAEGRPDPDTGHATLSWRRPPMGGFRRDPGAALTFALEVFDQESGDAAPAPILLHRVNVPPTPVTSADTPADALAVSRGEGRGVDLQRIGDLLGLTPQEALTALGDLVFTDPSTNELTTADQYLSGDVRAKIASARAAGLQRNVTALEAVQPTLLTETDISIHPGAAWIPADVIADFTDEVFGGRCSVDYDQLTGHWSVSRGWASGQARISFGTDDREPTQLLEHLLNNTAPVITREVPVGDSWRETRKVRDQKATLACEEQMQAIAERFTTWVWEDPDRAHTLVGIYNTLFNSHVPRTFTGEWLTFPGLAAGFTPWGHQRRMVERIISCERVLCGHPVGAGKTSESIMAAVTLRRFGLASKPLIAVPNHLLEQYAREAQQLYPTGRFLVATKDDLTRERRRLFAARCATGEWDAVIVTHQAFASIALSTAADQSITARQESQALDGLYEQGVTATKQLSKKLRSFRTKAEKMATGMGDRDQVFFDQLGVDYLMVDEAHMFKRLDVGAGRDQGFSTGSSKRAWDLQRKIEWLALQHPARPIVTLFTGTPWSNSIVETFVWQRYLQPDRLAAAAVSSFPSWASTFVRFESKVEVSPDGSTFRVQRRPAVIQNLPELMGMLSDVADVLTPEQIGLQRPDFTERNVEVAPTSAQETFIRELAERSEAIHQGAVPAEEDNMLKVCGDGRKVALDPQLVALDATSPKVNAAADEIARIWDDTHDRRYRGRQAPGALQIVFCDLGTPGDSGTQTYGRLRSALVERGVPADRVRFIHEASTGRQRDALFQQCRDGQVSVLIGSTEKMGTGANIQDRAVAVHHMDPPWRPSDITQREGRALRPGNLNDHVQIIRYVARGTFDAFSFQTLERKARFIAQLMGASSGQREVEDISDSVLTFSQVKAIAAGNPMLLEHAQVRSDIRRLRVLRAVQSQGAKRALKDAEVIASEATLLKEQATTLKTSLERHDPTGTWDSVPRAVRSILQGRSFSEVAEWQGLVLNVRDCRAQSGRVEIDVTRHRFTPGAIPVGHVSARAFSDVPSAVRLIRQSLARWVTKHLHVEELERLQSRSRALRSHSDEMTASAEAFVFDRQTELEAAEFRLRQIERAMEERAIEDARPESDVEAVAA
ncbi:helicase-related protein [Pseudoclavibacter sp. CFCC 13796]|uniref:helicase-related protein n=1 Tax=Pseudoclavibacter sp. CFCC 13796 TaxID=2615179 RepID=UPI0017879741|nr:helicase-related protein [Pseudoclavibacter sp. CFCC 13796]